MARLQFIDKLTAYMQHNICQYDYRYCALSSLWRAPASMRLSTANMFSHIIQSSAPSFRPDLDVFLHIASGNSKDSFKRQWLTGDDVLLSSHSAALHLSDTAPLQLPCS